MRKKAVVFAVIGILLVGFGGVMSFVKSFAKEVTDAQESLEAIQTQYQLSTKNENIFIQML